MTNYHNDIVVDVNSSTVSHYRYFMTWRSWQAPSLHAPVRSECQQGKWNLSLHIFTTIDCPSSNSNQISHSDMSEHHGISFVMIAHEYFTHSTNLIQQGKKQIEQNARLLMGNPSPTHLIVMGCKFWNNPQYHLKSFMQVPSSTQTPTIHMLMT